MKKAQCVFFYFFTFIIFLAQSSLLFFRQKIVHALISLPFFPIRLFIINYSFMIKIKTENETRDALIIGLFSKFLFHLFSFACSRLSFCFQFFSFNNNFDFIYEKIVISMTVVSRRTVPQMYREFFRSRSSLFNFTWLVFLCTYMKHR